MMLTILQRSTPLGRFLPYAMLRHTLILNEVYPPQLRSLEGLSMLLGYMYSLGKDGCGHLPVPGGQFERG